MNSKIAFVAALTVLSGARWALADGLAQSEPQTSAPAGETASDEKAAADTRRDNRATGQAAKLTARLVDADANARQKSATVEVKVSGVRIVDPAAAGMKPKEGQGHLHYKVDDGPVIATTATKLSFHNLSPGQHAISVMLSGNDHAPLGPSETLSFTVPRQ